MLKTKLGILLVLLLGSAAVQGVPMHAQNFGSGFQRKKIVLLRKLPPTGHIDGSTFTVNVKGANVPLDVMANLQSTVESLLVSNDARLRSVAENEHPDAVINCQVTTFSQPAATTTQQPAINFGKKALPPQTMTHVSGLLTVTFNAQDRRSNRSIAAGTATAKFEQDYYAQSPQAKPSIAGGLGGMISHLPKVPGTGQAGSEEEGPPTPAELRDQLIKDMSFQIASRLVNTTEQVPVLLARGGGLDAADTLMDQKLWTRALENLDTMTPLAQPEDDAYRLYDLGVANEALGYQAEDVTMARKYLQEAAIDYGKAIDSKPAEKYFLQPQTRIDTALVHYKTLGEQAKASAAAASSPAAAAAAADTLSNADVISMVAAKLDEANILDTIKHAGAVNFDLSAHGQIDLAKGNVNGRIITAMKEKARGQK